VLTGKFRYSTVAFDKYDRACLFATQAHSEGSDF